MKPDENETVSEAVERHEANQEWKQEVANDDAASLNTIGIDYGTDQSSMGHDYLSRLEPFFAPFRHRPIRLLEIGVAGGASLLTWASYFRQSEVYGIDHNPQCLFAIPEQQRFRPRISICVCDASYEQDWQTLRTLVAAPLDIVIDDASHNVGAIWQAFKFGWPFLKSGGLWIVEDCHAGYVPDYRRDNERFGLPREWTADDLFHDISKARLHEFGANQSGKIYSDACDISFIHSSKSLIVIGKR